MTYSGKCSKENNFLQKNYIKLNKKDKWSNNHFAEDIT